MPTITFSITDPSNGDAPYNIETGEAFIQSESRIAIDIGWDTEDYSNTGSGSEVPGFRPGSPAQVVSLNPLGGNATDNGDGTFSITSNVAIPAFVEGTLVVGLEGHPAVDVEGLGEYAEVPVDSVVAYFPVTDPKAVPRRVVVDIENCNNCHENLSLHGGNRTNEPQLCVACHNPNATDIRARVEGGVDEMTSADGKKEETIDFKQMVHAIHAGETLIYGFGGGLHDYTHVEFPGQLNDCENCHDGDTYYPVNQSQVLATTIDSGADLASPYDDVNISPNASACYGCHRETEAIAHMTLNGASFDATQEPDGTLIDNVTGGVVIESCEVCHDEGRIADVGVVHVSD